MWIPFVAAVVIGLAVWWLRRRPAAEPAPEVVRTGWRSRLGEEAATALLEGLRAFSDTLDRGLVIDDAAGVVMEPSRLVSLDLLAHRFAARGQAAMYDPQTAVAELMGELTAAERPGVLRLREGWTDGGGFTEAVRKILCPEGAAVERPGALGVAVLGVTMLIDLARVQEAFEESRARQPGATDDVVLRSVLTGAIANGGPGLTWTAPPTERQLSNALAAAGPVLSG
jgi:hypothetical protein